MTETTVVETYEVREWDDGTAGWLCLRDDCGRFAGPYGNAVTAHDRGGWHQSKDHGKVERG